MFLTHSIQNKVRTNIIERHKSSYIRLVCLRVSLKTPTSDDSLQITPRLLPQPPPHTHTTAVFSLRTLLVCSSTIHHIFSFICIYRNWTLCSLSPTFFLSSLQISTAKPSTAPWTRARLRRLACPPTTNLFWASTTLGTTSRCERLVHHTNTCEWTQFGLRAVSLCTINFTHIWWMFFFSSNQMLFSVWERAKEGTWLVEFRAVKGRLVSQINQLFKSYRFKDPVFSLQGLQYKMAAK